VSGGVRLENVQEIAQTGIQRVSIGALTHSAPAADVALELTAPGGVRK
jgi:nicotinate-nucleotide pyrophosphorylase (carboxylating)